MFRANIHDVKTHLSEYLERGETIIICRRNVPIAELRALPTASVKPRPVGLAKGKIKVPRAFFEPLPKEIVDGLSGLDR